MNRDDFSIESDRATANRILMGDNSPADGTSRKPALRILFADDHALLREGLHPFLAQMADATDIREAETLPAALECFTNTTPPDIAVLDLNMPGMDGFNGIAIVKRKYPMARVVVLSGYFDKKTVSATIAAGADGFVPKTFSGRMLVSALKLVLDGETYIPTATLNAPLPDAARIPGVDLDGDQSVWAKLTPREGDILRLVIDGNTNKEIGRVLGLNEITIKGHLRNAYKKIGASNRADAVRIALQNRFN
jgi:DNA-binding NarL/FixJ family response regulator